MPVLRTTMIHYLERALLKRRRGIAESAMLRSAGYLWPGFFATRKDALEDFVGRRRVSIVSPSDGDPDLFRRLQWADTWAKYELIKALNGLGYLVTDVDPHVVIHLFGEPAELPSSARKVLWIYSHPGETGTVSLSRYDRIFCTSQALVEKVRRRGFEAEVLWLATSRRARPGTAEYDVVFVGNARGGRRRVVADVGTPDYRFKVWGRGYRDLPERYWAGPYVDYCGLGELYSSSLITLSDHSPDMASEGMVSPRVFDILASGGFCISDENPGLNEIFGDAVPQYHSASDLADLIHFYLHEPDRRLPLMERGRTIALSHTWSDRAGRMLEGLPPTLDR